MWPVWSDGWRKSTRAAGKSLFLRKEPAEPHTENISGPYNIQGSWHRAQHEDFWTVEVIHEPPLGCLQGDLLKSNTQDSRSLSKLWGTQYVVQGKRVCLSAHNSPRAGRGKTMPCQAHPSPPVTSTQSSSGHCSCHPQAYLTHCSLHFLPGFHTPVVSLSPYVKNPLDTTLLLLGPLISHTWFIAVLQMLEREKLFS